MCVCIEREKEREIERIERERKQRAFLICEGSERRERVPRREHDLDMKLSASAGLIAAETKECAAMQSLSLTPMSSAGELNLPAQILPNTLKCLPRPMSP